MQRDTGWSAKRESLGEFVFFPTTIHGVVKATYNDKPAKMQLAVIRALNNLNSFKCPYSLSVAGRDGTYLGKVGFEIGIAEGMYFHYLDDEKTEMVCNSIIQEHSTFLLDFLVIVTYHYTRHTKRIPLNFDYHQLRFILYENELELRLFHSKGIRRMPLDEFVNRVLDAIKKEMEQQSLKPLSIKEVNTL